MRSTTPALLALSALLPLAACEREPSSGTRPNPSVPTTNTRTTPSNPGLADPTKAPDNTAQNKPDRDMDSTITPEDQSNQDSDVDLTAAIRRAVVQDDSLSMNAKNVKIIADKSGTVTLRGVVDSQAEKDAVESKAKAVAGVRTVNNMIEVKAP
jgi:hyperosmotically inducible protein